jgi:hypothetical protein
LMKFADGDRLHVTHCVTLLDTKQEGATPLRGVEPRSRVFGLTVLRAFFSPPIFSGHDPLSMAHIARWGALYRDTWPFL